MRHRFLLVLLLLASSALADPKVDDLPPQTTRVVIHTSRVPLWAFATVTNNDAQQITMPL
jgi:hypothetical protein